MSSALHWQSEAGTLWLKGKLDPDTLLPLWQQRNSVMREVNTIDVSGLDRVDSAGLALLVHLRETIQALGETPQFKGIDDKLRSLVNLYSLQQIIVSDENR